MHNYSRLVEVHFFQSFRGISIVSLEKSRFDSPLKPFASSTGCLREIGSIWIKAMTMFQKIQHMGKPGTFCKTHTWLQELLPLVWPHGFSLVPSRFLALGFLAGPGPNLSHLLCNMSPLRTMLCKTLTHKVRVSHRLLSRQDLPMKSSFCSHENEIGLMIQ